VGRMCIIANRGRRISSGYGSGLGHLRLIVVRVRVQYSGIGSRVKTYRRCRGIYWKYYIYGRVDVHVAKAAVRCSSGVPHRAFDGTRCGARASRGYGGSAMPDTELGGAGGRVGRVTLGKGWRVGIVGVLGC
jgi:hypothetical protein